MKMELVDRYQQAAFDLLFKARTTQRENIEKAGKIIADAIMQGGKIYLHNICHSIEMDLYNRGGGPEYYRLYDKEKPELTDKDVLIVSSVSGRTKSVVDLAWNSIEKGTKVIAFISMEYARAVEPVHPSGKKLYEFVTLAVDNCAPAAEAMLEVEGLEPRFAAASGIASDFILWSITAVTLQTMMEKGCTPGILKSANFPGGPEFNEKVREHYQEMGW